MVKWGSSVFLFLLLILCFKRWDTRTFLFLYFCWQRVLPLHRKSKFHKNVEFMKLGVACVYPPKHRMNFNWGVGACFGHPEILLPQVGRKISSCRFRLLFAMLIICHVHILPHKRWEWFFWAVFSSIFFLSLKTPHNFFVSKTIFIFLLKIFSLF